jgi:hypothetical protein
MSKPIQDFLKTELGLSEERPYWEIYSEPGHFSKHAGWVVKSKNPLIVTRTLGLKDGSRVRVGSVDLNLSLCGIQDLDDQKLQTLVSALQNKAQSHQKAWPQNISEPQQKILKKFLSACQHKIDAMTGELVGFKGTPEHIQKTFRNVKTGLDAE